MELPHTMNTVSEILNKLRLKNIDNEFRCYKTGFSVNKNKFYQPSDLSIVKIYRFEGITDPGDMSIIYIIRAIDGLTGYSFDAYGTYSNHDYEPGYDNFIRMVPVANHEEQILFEL